MTTNQQITISEASYPVPFQPGLEFNPPAHGVPNIVHVGMQVPEAQQIYVCAINCMRGVILTAAEMGLSHRFSFVILNEEDLLEGTVEDITIEGVADVIEKLPQKPPAVILFTVCLHRFLGSDLERIYGELSRRYPDITFIRATMEPITQKGGLTPDQRLRKSIFDPLQALPQNCKKVCILGGDFPLDEGCDIKKLLRRNGYTVAEPKSIKTYQEFLKLGESSLFLSVFPRAAYGCTETAQRLERAPLYLPASFDYEEITEELNTLCEKLQLPASEYHEEIAACEAALSELHALLGNTAISIDFTVHPRPLGLARLLLSHGMNVDTVYLDSIAPEEQQDYAYLQKAFPTLLLKPTNQAVCRIEQRGRNALVVAIGQIAAWRDNTPHFVNMVEGGGLWGFDGIISMTELIKEAYLEEKDTEDLIPRKGLGCDSCI